MRNLESIPFAIILLSISRCSGFITTSIHCSLDHRSAQNRALPNRLQYNPVISKVSHGRETPLYSKSLQNDDSSSDQSTTTTPTIPIPSFSFSMIFLPITSLIFPTLLDYVRALPPNSSEQLGAVTILFVSNRVYLYIMAATIVGLAACRGSNDSPQLGKRITDLTEELLYRPSLEPKKSSSNDNQSLTTILGDAGSIRGVPDIESKPRLIQSLTDSGFEQRLDDVSTETKALLLPLFVTFSLALSIFLLPFWSGTSPPSFIDDIEQASVIKEILSQILPTINQVWNVGLLMLFTRSEVRRLRYEVGAWIPDSAILEWVVAMGITGLACFGQIWPAQNFVNMSLAILVSRAIQLDSFATVVGALSLLTIYDATSVFLIPAAGAVDIPSSLGLAASKSQTVAGGSAMGSVAIQKLTSASFTPGLLTTKIGNNLGGALGLGDAVFPSLLASFAKRFDNDADTPSDRGKLSLFTTCMIGYLLGCLASEFAPFISTSGLPALVFLIPLMLGSLFLGSAISGQLQDLIAYNPKR